MTLTTSAKSTLIIAPHADDEVIGCGGAAALATERGERVVLLVMATGGVKHHHLDQCATVSERCVELQASCNVLGIADYRVLFPGHDMQLERMWMLDIVTALDAVVRSESFDEVYIPEPSHNRDHQITYDAAIAALRPCGGSSPNLIAAYEGTSLTVDLAVPRCGDLYVNIASSLSKKCNALRAYKSQIREYPHPTSEEAIRRLAAMRGMESGVEHAERFRLLRMLRH